MILNIGDGRSFLRNDNRIFPSLLHKSFHSKIETYKQNTLHQCKYVGRKRKFKFPRAFVLKDRLETLT